MSLSECAQGQPATGDLRSQLQALLGASELPRQHKGPPRRRKPHPLYSASGSGGTASGAPRHQASSLVGRSRSQPPSPTGISKARVVCNRTSRGPARGSASVGTSPVQQALRQPIPACIAPCQLPFGSRSPTAPATQEASPRPGSAVQGQAVPQPQQAEQGRQSGSTTADLLPDFARLGIASPTTSPEKSPAHLQTQQPSPWQQKQWQQAWPLQRQTQQQQQQQQASTPSPSQPGAVSQRCCVRQQVQQACSPLLESPVPPTPSRSDSDAENSWSVAPSPLWAGPPAQCPGPSPDVCCPQQPLASPAQQPALPGAAAGAASASPSPFNSSQERRQEIAILMEMAAQAGAWSSQEEGEAAQPAPPHQPGQQPQPGSPQLQQHGTPEPLAMQLAQQHQERAAQQDVAGDGPTGALSPQPHRPGQRGTASPASPGASHPAAAAAAVLASPAWAGSQGSQGSRQPYTCSFTSQELDELPDPCSQPGEAAQQEQDQRHQSGQPAEDAEQTGNRAGGQEEERSEQQWRMQDEAQQQQQQQQQQHSDGQRLLVAPAPASPQAPAVVLQQQYPQRGAGLNQWAAVGQPHGSAEAEAEAARRQREAAEDALVAATCPLPHLRGALHNFPTQREAFAAADQLNRPMPQLRSPHVIMSAVPLEQLLPAGSCAGQGGISAGAGRGADSNGSAGPEGSAQQQQAPASSSSGDSGITVPGRQAGHTACEADSAGQPLPQLRQPQQQEQQQAADFLSRYGVGALPAPGSGGYVTAPLAKRQREEGEEERRQRERRLASKAQEYQALLRVHQEEVVTAAQRQQAAQQQAQRQQAQRQQAQRQRQAAADPAPAASAGQAGPAAEASAEGLWREEAVRTFCVERRGRSGAYYRSFTAASYPAVWAAFRRSHCEARHWYEVVREGRPAHLYFDLEFDPRLNRQVHGDALVDRLLAHVDQQLRRHFGLALDPRCVYELDSSTPAKFSRHLTVRLPGHAFATNHAMGKFVGQVLAASGSELLVVRGEKDGAPQLGFIVDTAVYSKNRHWRMSYCCKGGKAAVLVPTRRYATAPGATTSTAHVFLDTLVCNVDPRARLLQMPDPLPRPVGGQGGHGIGGITAGGGAAVTAAATVCGDGVQRHVAWKREAGDAALSWEHMQELQRLAEAALAFIERVATRRAGGAPARARTLAFCGAGATVAYSMVGPGSHHCENVGRPHASNHVFFVADFVRGAYAQKCHDPDCARYRSGWMPLPPELCLPEGRAAAMGLAAPPSPSGSRRSGASC